MCADVDFERQWFSEWLSEPTVHGDAAALLARLIDESPDDAWLLIRRLVDTAESPHAMQCVAAGPLEDLLCAHGPLVIARIEVAAEDDPHFKQALATVGGYNRMAADVRHRVSGAAGTHFVAPDRGFLVVPGIFTPAEVAALSTQVEAMSRGRAGLRHVLSHAAIMRLAHDARLVALAGALLGGVALPFKGTLFDKSPRTNWLVTWHQDLSLPVRTRVETAGWGPWSIKGGRLYALAPAEVLRHIVALRVHLDDNTAENGPLRVLPDTHTLGRLSDTRIADLARSVTAHECLVPAGGVVAMRPLVVHASSRSTSALPRRVLHFEYATTTVVGPGLELAADRHEQPEPAVPSS